MRFDVERRIEQLSTEQERRDAFEDFVEAYLNADEAAQADDVWIAGKVPAEIRRMVNLPASDFGYDGVFRTRPGNWSRTKRSSAQAAARCHIVSYQRFSALPKRPNAALSLPTP